VDRGAKVPHDAVGARPNGAAMKRTVDVGVIGLGYWGPKLVRNLNDAPNTSLTWVADLDSARLDRAKAQYPGVHVTTDYRQLLSSDVEAVIIATPIRTHYQIARAALLSSKHVLVEKPLAATSDEAADLIDLAEHRSLTLMVGHTFIHNPAIRALRDIVKSGELGEIYCVDMARLNLGIFHSDVNVLWDLAPHDLSILLYILQNEPIEISVQGRASVNRRVHDIAYLALSFQNDLMAHIHVSWLSPCKVRQVTIVGSKKMVVCDDLKETEKIRIYDKGVDKPYETDQFTDFPLSYRYGSVTIPHIPLQEPLQVQCRHFADCILSGVRPETDGYDGLRVVRILERADMSLQGNGGRVSLSADFAPAHLGTDGLFASQAEALSTVAGL
jgi:predicted dehydrogenase